METHDGETPMVAVSNAITPIPVIDLFDGQVVHAIRGQRDAYRPVASSLTDTSSPAAVLAGYLTVFPFRHCYLADLNALQARDDNAPALAALLAPHREIEFWIDAAFGPRSPLPAYLTLSNARGIIGSESLATLEDYDRLRLRLASRLEPVLSLDFKAGKFLGPPALLADPTRWPQRVVVMNLDRVGSGEGPDLARLQEIRSRAPHCLLTAAGGIRDEADLERLREVPVAFVLLATALHDGRIGATELTRLTKVNP